MPRKLLPAKALKKRRVEKRGGRREGAGRPKKAQPDNEYMLWLGSICESERRSEAHKALFDAAFGDPARVSDHPAFDETDAKRRAREAAISEVPVRLRELVVQAAGIGVDTAAQEAAKAGIEALPNHEERRIAFAGVAAFAGNLRAKRTGFRSIVIYTNAPANGAIERNSVIRSVAQMIGESEATVRRAWAMYRAKVANDSAK